MRRAVAFVLAVAVVAFLLGVMLAVLAIVDTNGAVLFRILCGIFGLLGIVLGIVMGFRARKAAKSPEQVQSS